jgi:hypothetical protein
MRVIKSRRLSYVGHMEYMENFRNAYDIIGEKSEKGNPLGDLGIKARILKEICGLDPSGCESVLGEDPSENIIYLIIPERD